jgi:hypothetical protein
VQEASKRHAINQFVLEKREIKGGARKELSWNKGEVTWGGLQKDDGVREGEPDIELVGYLSWTDEFSQF